MSDDNEYSFSDTEFSYGVDTQPTKVSNTEVAERHNTGKPLLSMISLTCLTPCAEVLQWACTEKVNPYPKNNWRKGMPVSKILDSLLRHIGDLQDGKVLDDESKKRLIGHIQCNSLFLGNDKNIDDVTTDGNLYK